ncbi:MAG: type II toxin-antitoxin system VapC family toxin [Gaiellaceae bacterium]
MGAVLLDTTVIIDFLRGREGARRFLSNVEAAEDTAYTCAINVEETVRGLRPQEEEKARALFAGLRTAPLGTEEGWRAGEWRREQAARGHTLAQADCLVAAAALSLGARLATGNPKDFPFAELTVEHRPVEA